MIDFDYNLVQEIVEDVKKCDDLEKRLFEILTYDLSREKLSVICLKDTLRKFMDSASDLELIDLVEVMIRSLERHHLKSNPS